MNHWTDTFRAAIEIIVGNWNQWVVPSRSQWPMIVVLLVIIILLGFARTNQIRKSGFASGQTEGTTSFILWSFVTSVSLYLGVPVGLALLVGIIWVYIGSVLGWLGFR